MTSIRWTESPAWRLFTPSLCRRRLAELDRTVFPIAPWTPEAALVRGSPIAVRHPSGFMTVRGVRLLVAARIGIVGVGTMASMPSARSPSSPLAMSTGSVKMTID